MKKEEIRTAIEPPFLVVKNGLRYLFYKYHKRYEETIVVVSDTPNYFSYKTNCLTTLFGHTAEIFISKCKSYISSCGAEDRQSLTNREEYPWQD